MTTETLTKHQASSSQNHQTPLTDIREQTPEVLPHQVDAPDIREYAIEVARKGTPDSLLNKAKKHAGTAAAMALRGVDEVRQEQEIESAKGTAVSWIDSLGINPDETYQATLEEEDPDSSKPTGYGREQQPRKIVVGYDPKSRTLDIKDQVKPGWWRNGRASISHTAYVLAFDWQGKVTDIQGMVYDPGESRDRALRSEYHEEQVAISDSSVFTEKEFWEDAIIELSKVKRGIKTRHTEVMRAGVRLEGENLPVIIRQNDPEFEYQLSEDPRVAYIQKDKARYARELRRYGRRGAAAVLSLGALATGLGAAEGNGTLMKIENVVGTIAPALSVANIAKSRSRRVMDEVRAAGEPPTIELKDGRKATITIPPSKTPR